MTENEPPMTESPVPLPSRNGLLVVLLVAVALGGVWAYDNRERLWPEPAPTPSPHIACHNDECVGYCCHIPTPENGKLVMKHQLWCKCTRRCPHCK